jgi:hypothetical protein
VIRTSLLLLLLAGCSTNTGGRCVEWITVEKKQQDCTRLPYRICVITVVPEPVCIRREVGV